MGDWPAVQGRYKVGNGESCVAVCTNASIDDINLDMKKVAITGKCVTENIGMEKIIENCISNPNIRFLINCGKPSKGHFPGECFDALIKNGVDREKRIMGAIGNMPFLKNLEEGQIERFREQVKVINLSNEKDPVKIMEAVDMCIRKNPGRFQGREIVAAEIEEIQAEKNRDFVEDPNGYFLIGIDKKGRRIIAEHIKDGKIDLRIAGRNNEEVRDTIARLKLIRPEFTQAIEHAMCIGRELYKAEMALKHNFDYEQDSDLEIKKEIKKEIKEDNEWYD